MFNAFDNAIHISYLNEIYNNNANLYKLNCSQWLSVSERSRLEKISKLHKFSKKPANLIPREILHNCMRENPYNTKQLPIREVPPPFHIKYGLCLTKIMSITNYGTLTAKGLLQLGWWDQHRIWDTNAYIGNWKYPNDLVLPVFEVWVPTFYLIGCEEQDCFIKPDNKSAVSFNNNGLAEITNEFRFQSSCGLYLKHFPFDGGKCRLSFVYYATDEEEDVLLLEDIKTEFNFTFYGTEEWHFRRIYQYTNQANNSFCATDRYIMDGGEEGEWYKYSDVRETRRIICVELYFRRNVEFYMFNLIAPSFVMTVCGFFAMFLSRSLELKLEFLTGILNGFIFMQTIVANVSPKTLESTDLGKFILISIALCLFNVVGTIIVLSCENLDQKWKTPPPLVLRFIFIKVYRCLSYPIKKCLCCCCCCCFCCFHYPGCSCCHKTQHTQDIVVTDVQMIETISKTSKENPSQSSNIPAATIAEEIDRTSKNCLVQIENWSLLSSNINIIISAIYAIGTIFNSYIIYLFFLSWAFIQQSSDWYIDKHLNEN